MQPLPRRGASPMGTHLTVGCKICQERAAGDVHKSWQCKALKRSVFRSASQEAGGRLSCVSMGCVRCVYHGRARVRWKVSLRACRCAGMSRWGLNLSKDRIRA